MNKAIIGKKIGMTQIFDENAKVIPVTVVEAGPCVVVQKKNLQKDGYYAVQLGFGDIKLKFRKDARSEKFKEKPSNISMSMQGHFAKAGVAPKRILREFRLIDATQLNVGDIVKAEVFAEGDHIDVSGISKGKGYAGAIKRWNCHRLKETHGSGPVVRHQGSLGACSCPGRVFKGKKMPGHLGAEKVTVQNLVIVKIDSGNNLIAIKGAVPGPKGGTVTLRQSVKA